MVTAFFFFKCQARAPTGTCITCKTDWIGNTPLTKSYIIRNGSSYRNYKGRASHSYKSSRHYKFMLPGLWHCQTEAIVELQVLYVHITRTFSAFGGKVNAIRTFGGLGDRAQRFNFKALFTSVVCSRQLHGSPMLTKFINGEQNT